MSFLGENTDFKVHLLWNNSTLINWSSSDRKKKKWRRKKNESLLWKMVKDQSRWCSRVSGLVCDLCQLQVKHSNKQPCCRGAFSEPSPSLSHASHPLERNKCFPYQFLPLIVFNAWLPLLTRCSVQQSYLAGLKRHKQHLHGGQQQQHNCLHGFLFLYLAANLNFSLVTIT